MRDRSFLRKLLTVLTLLLLAPISLVTMFSYRSITRYAEEEIGEFHSLYLRSMSQSVDVMVDSLIDMAMYAAMSEKISQLDFLPWRDQIDDGREAVACMNAYNLLGEIVLTNSNLHSAHIYLRGSQYILSSDMGMAPLDRFYDTTWLDRAPEAIETGSVVWMDTRITGDAARGNSHVITFLYPLQGYVTNIQGVLVFNIREEAFSGLFGAFGFSENTGVAIAGPDGTILAARNKSRIGGALEKDTVERIAGEPERTGYFMESGDGGRSLVSYHRSGFQDWVYVGETSLETLLSRAGALNIRVLLFNLALAALILAGTYFIAVRVTSPLASLISDIRKRGGDRRGGDLALLNRTYASLLTKERRLLQLSEEHRDSVLLDLLYGRPAREKIRLEFPVCVAVAAVDREPEFAGRYQPEQQHYVKSMVVALFYQTAGAEWMARHLFLENGQMALVLQSAGDREALSALLRAFQSQVSAALGLSVTIGCSAGKRQEPELRQALQEAMTAVQGRIFHGYGGLHFYSGTAEARYWYPLAQEKRLMELLRMGDGPGAAEALADFFQTVRRRSGLTPDNAVQILSQLSGALMKHALEEHIGMNRLSPPGESLFTAISGAETLDAAEDAAKQLLLRMEEIALTAAPGNHAERMLQYIREHYAVDFGVEELADHVGLSYSHTRRLFKAEFGQTITEYLNRYRVERATELLRDPARSMSEIAEQVGYNNEQSFYRFFRKYMGATPGEYRRRIRD